MKVKNKITIATIIVTAFAILIMISYPKVAKDKKIKNINNLMSEFEYDYTTKTDVLKELEVYLEDKNSDISERANEVKEKINVLYKSKTVYDRVKKEVDESFNSLWDSEKAEYVKKLQEGVSQESIYYADAQELISKLGGSETTSTDIALESYSSHYDKGNQKLNIYLKNTSGKDIEYLSINIIEVDSNGDIVNSDWTNTSSLIKDGAKISLDTYFDYKSKDSKLKFEIKDIRYK